MLGLCVGEQLVCGAVVGEDEVECGGLQGAVVAVVVLVRRGLAEDGGQGGQYGLRLLQQCGGGGCGDGGQ